MPRLARRGENRSTLARLVRLLNQGESEVGFMTETGNNHENYTQLLHDFINDMLSAHEDMASEICAEFDTTPEGELKILDKAFNMHKGHTGGLFPVSRGGLLFDPVGVMRKSQTMLPQKLNRQRIAAILWLECKKARMLLKDPETHAQLFICGFFMSRQVMALKFPELQDAIMKESRTLFGKQGKKAEQARFDMVKDFCINTAKKSWAENTDEERKLTAPERPRQMAAFIFDAIKNPGEFKLTEKPSIDQIKNWIKPYAPEQAKRPGRPRKQ